MVYVEKRREELDEWGEPSLFGRIEALLLTKGPMNAYGIQKNLKVPHSTLSGELAELLAGGLIAVESSTIFRTGLKSNRYMPTHLLLDSYIERKRSRGGPGWEVLETIFQANEPLRKKIIEPLHSKGISNPILIHAVILNRSVFSNKAGWDPNEPERFITFLAICVLNPAPENDIFDLVTGADVILPLIPGEMIPALKEALTEYLVSNPSMILRTTEELRTLLAGAISSLGFVEKIVKGK